MGDFFQFMMNRFWQSLGSMIGIAAGIVAVVDGIKTQFKGGGRRKLAYAACGIAFIVAVLSLAEQYSLYKAEGVAAAGNEADGSGHMNNNSVDISGTGMAVFGSGNTVTINNLSYGACHESFQSGLPARPRGKPGREQARCGTACDGLVNTDAGSFWIGSSCKEI